MKDAVDVVEEVILGDRLAQIRSLEVWQCLWGEAARHFTRFTKVKRILCFLGLLTRKPAREALTIEVQLQINNAVGH